MAVTYGFYSSTNGDRKYSADQFGSLFRGIITDGIFLNVGQALEVSAGRNNVTTGSFVTIKPGRAWFMDTWIDNSEDFRLNLDGPDTLYDRIDAIVIEVDKNPTVRRSEFKAIKGTPSKSPQRPALYNSNIKGQFPLGYVRVTRGVPNIYAWSIVNNRGTSSCPFITGPLQTLQIDTLVDEWRSSWEHWFTDAQKVTDDAKRDLFASFKQKYDEWVLYMEDKLSGNQAAKLQMQIDRMRELLGEGSDDERLIYDTIEDNNGLTLFDSMGSPVIGRRVYKLQ